jgi:hypothetical protein
MKNMLILWNTVVVLDMRAKKRSLCLEKNINLLVVYDEEWYGSTVNVKNKIVKFLEGAMMSDKKFILSGKIELCDENSSLRSKASKIIELPNETERQPDLQYIKAILVSSGRNLNNAFFMPSELVAAEDTITNKALDIEHEEQNVVGCLIDRAYVDKEGNPLDVKELASRETASLDSQDMHIMISAVIYKNRFPNLAQEIADGKWDSVSMECYYQDYDIKIGDLVLDRREAEVMGLVTASEDILGKMAKVVKEGIEIATGEIARVLRGICFSGCGIVKNPANPDSKILETAKEKEKFTDEEKEIITLDYDSIEDNNLTSVNTEEAKDGNLDDSVGICVSYKKRVYNKKEEIIAEDWCSLYDKSCTSFSRDTTDPNCLRYKAIMKTAKAHAEAIIANRKIADKRGELLDELKAALREAVKTRSRR